MVMFSSPGKERPLGILGRKDEKGGRADIVVLEQLLQPLYILLSNRLLRGMITRGMDIRVATFQDLQSLVGKFVVVILVRLTQAIVPHLALLTRLRGLPITMYPQPIGPLDGFPTGIEPDPIFVEVIGYGQAWETKTGPGTGLLQQLVGL
jgi:hypothetical protein